MEGKLMKFMGAATIGSAILMAGPAVAQQSGKSAQPAQTQTAQAAQGSGSGSSSSQSDNASGGQTSSMEQRRVDDDRDWGWLGLLGLVGLAGLRRKRHDHDVRRDTARSAA